MFNEFICSTCQLRTPLAQQYAVSYSDGRRLTVCPPCAAEIVRKVNFGEPVSEAAEVVAVLPCPTIRRTEFLAPKPKKNALVTYKSYQFRGKLEPTGEDWDSAIDALSHAPVGKPPAEKAAPHPRTGNEVLDFMHGLMRLVTEAFKESFEAQRIPPAFNAPAGAASGTYRATLSVRVADILAGRHGGAYELQARDMGRRAGEHPERLAKQLCGQEGDAWQKCQRFGDWSLRSSLTLSDDQETVTLALEFRGVGVFVPKEPVPDAK